jgi:hypothetical protein
MIVAVYNQKLSEADIPRSNKAVFADERLTTIEKFLHDMERLTGLFDDKYRQFIRYATEFFVRDGKL